MSINLSEATARMCLQKDCSKKLRKQQKKTPAMKLFSNKERTPLQVLLNGSGDVMSSIFSAGHR